MEIPFGSQPSRRSCTVFNHTISRNAAVFVIVVGVQTPVAILNKVMSKRKRERKVVCIMLNRRTLHSLICNLTNENR